MPEQPAVLPQCKDPDHFTQADTEWRREWRATVPAEWLDIPRNGYTPDITRPDGLTMFIVPDTPTGPQVLKCEHAFRDTTELAWLFDARNRDVSMPWNRKPDPTRWDNDNILFDWEAPREASTRQMFIDLGMHPYKGSPVPLVFRDGVRAWQPDGQSVTHGWLFRREKIVAWLQTPGRFLP
jgi:hypothetical protein